VTYLKREQESQKLRIGGGSWSINLDELPPTAKQIKYITEEGTYQISVDDALAHGFERMLGGERKLVVPLGKWKLII